MAERRPHKRRILRWALRVSVALALVILVLGVFLWSGLPQTWAVEWAARRYLGAPVAVRWSGTAPVVKLARVVLYPNREAQQKNAPILEAQDVRIEYALFPQDGRMIRLVSIGSVRVHADASDPEHPNYAFILDLLNQPQPETPADTRFLPERVIVKEIAGAARLPEAYAEISGVTAQATLKDASQVEGSLESKAAEIGWWLESDEYAHHIANVQLDASGALNELQASWKMYGAAEGLFHVGVKGTNDLGGETPAADVQIDDAWVAGRAIEAYSAPFELPLSFETARISSGSVAARFSETPEYNLTLDGGVSGLKLRDAAEPLYKDSIDIAVHGEMAQELSGEATATFAQGQSIRMSMKGSRDEGSFTTTAADWSKDEFVSVLPAAFQDPVGALGFEAFTAHVTGTWKDGSYDVTGRAESSGGEGMASPIFWAFDAEGSLEGGQAVQGFLEARLGDRLVQASARYTDENHYHAEARIEQVDLAPWLRFAAGPQFAEQVRGTVEGTVEASVDGAGAPLTIRPELTFKTLAYDTVTLDEVDVTGAIAYAQDTDRLTIDTLRADAPDGTTYAHLANWTYDPERESGSGEVDLGVDLALVGKLTDLPDLLGSGTATGAAKLKGDQFTCPFTLHSDYLGYGEVLMPYGTEVAGNGELRLDLSKRTGTLENLMASMGEGTHMTMAAARFAAEPMRVEGDMQFESDLQLLVAMGWLASVEGRLEEDSHFVVTDAGLDAHWKLTIDAPTLVLPDNAGFAEGAHFDGSGTYGESGLGGTGQVRATRLSAAGGSIWNAEGPAQFEGNRMHIQPVRGTLFNGTLEANVNVGVLEPELPIFLTGEFRNVDLAELTDEVKPPNTHLTGIAQGNMSVDYTVEKLRGFTLEAQAPKGLTVNRSLVADLLQSENLLAGMGERVAQRAMDKILGTKPQRPFDSGKLYVYLVGDTIQGQVELKSEQTKDYHGLNLTVNLDMDQSALAETLQLLEESSLADVEF